MVKLKIKLEDKAAFLNRMEKVGEEVSSNQIKDNKLDNTFEITIIDPEQAKTAKSILKQSPKINTLKEMESKKSLTKDKLKEMIRQELSGVLAEKKKMKDEDKKENLDENVLNEIDPNLVAGAIGFLGTGAAILIPYITALSKAKSKEEKAKITAQLSGAIDKAMSGNEPQA
jgi:signal recognition particle GTPase